MGWETRKGRGRYYTRSRRVGGRVVREYVGSGKAAKSIADMDAQKNAEREEHRKAEAAEREKCRELGTTLAQLCEDTDVLVRAALLIAGYRQHHRGEWRRKRKRDGNF